MDDDLKIEGYLNKNNECLTVKNNSFDFLFNYNNPLPLKTIINDQINILKNKKKNKKCVDVKKKSQRKNISKYADKIEKKFIKQFIFKKELDSDNNFNLKTIKTSQLTEDINLKKKNILEKKTNLEKNEDLDSLKENKISKVNTIFNPEYLSEKKQNSEFNLGEPEFLLKKLNDSEIYSNSKLLTQELYKDSLLSNESKKDNLSFDSEMQENYLSDPKIDKASSLFDSLEIGKNSLEKNESLINLEIKENSDENLESITDKKEILETNPINEQINQLSTFSNLIFYTGIGALGAFFYFLIK